MRRHIGLFRKGDYLGHQTPIHNGIRTLMPCAIDAAHFRLLGVGRHTDDYRRIEPTGQAGGDRHVTAHARATPSRNKSSSGRWQNSLRGFLAGVGLNLMILSFVG
jgi:hypothetical protein